MIKAVVIGASGYTGAELVRILDQHPDIKIAALVANSNAGKAIAEIYPHFSHLDLPDMVSLNDVKFDEIDVAFCCLPHATSQEVIQKLPDDLRIIDLSADFRIDDLEEYEYWYGKPHAAPELQKEAVYGLTELSKEKVEEARLVACPGCYPTSMLLPLYPLLQGGKIRTRNIIIDSKSGVTGAGRSAKIANLFAEVSGSVRPYSIGGHRHVAEVEQELSRAAGEKIQITFTPQVVPMNRGICSCIYVEAESGVSVENIQQALVGFYADTHFVTVVTDGHVPTTQEVYGTNRAVISVFADRVPGRVIIISVIDNLVKGASGQAVQNMNIMFGLGEGTGLQRTAMFP